MKAVFLNDSNHIDSVYPGHMINEMSAVMDLYPAIISKSALSRHAEVLRNAEAVFSTWGMPALSAEEIKEYLPNLKIVFYAAGSVQSFARPFLENGIKVISAWASNSVSVVEFCTSIILLSLKGFFPALQMARGDWASAHEIVQKHCGCYRSTVGLLGLGMIGHGVAKKLAGTDVHIIAYDPYVPEERFRQSGISRSNTIKEVFTKSEVVSNHIANLPQNKEILRYEHFSALPQYGTFINTGRNAQVHVPGLVQAFSEVPTRTAFFDVTDPDEPPSAKNPLLALSNAYFSPHMSGSTGFEVQRMGAYMLEEFKRYIKGERLQWEITEDMLSTMA